MEQRAQSGELRAKVVEPNCIRLEIDLPASARLNDAVGQVRPACPP